MRLRISLFGSDERSELLETCEMGALLGVVATEGDKVVCVSEQSALYANRQQRWGKSKGACPR